MEPNKFEKEFRDKLNQREISPSENSWNKLDAMLTAAEEKKKSKHSYSWIYVAASFVGFLLIATFYFSQKENTIENQKNGLVIQNPVAPKTDAIPSEKADLKIEEKSSVVNVVQKSASKSNKSSFSRKDSLANKNNFNQNQVAELSIINQNTEQFASSNANEKSVDEMIVAVQATPKAAASKTAIKVNPNTLLSQVDGELELSFREKVINKVNKNYQTVKVALVNRNQE